VISRVARPLFRDVCDLLGIALECPLAPTDKEGGTQWQSPWNYRLTSKPVWRLRPEPVASGSMPCGGLLKQQAATERPARAMSLEQFEAELDALAHGPWFGPLALLRGPKSRTGTAATANRALIQGATAGGKCASSQRFMSPGPDGPGEAWRIEARP